MLKRTLITALLTFSGLMAYAETPAAPAATASAAAPAKATTAAKAATPAASASSAPNATSAGKTATAEPEVKKSKAGVCHDKTSKGYKQTKNFTEFTTMDDCIKSGGRAPKK
jgi:hypothetical protein